MSADRTILIVGTDGIIGSALGKKMSDCRLDPWQTSRRISSVDRSKIHLDLNQSASEWKLPAGIKLAYICASRAALSDCRDHPAGTWLVNVEATEALAQRLVESGSRVVYLSSNLVYDGSVPYRKCDETPCPATEYGRQKAEAERRLLALGSQVTVVRLTKVLSPAHGILNEWRCLLESNQPIHPFSDLSVAPIDLQFVAMALMRMIDLDCPGIIQISGRQDVSYAAVAKQLAARLGAAQDLVQPITASQSAVQLESLPTYSTLDASLLTSTLSIDLPDVWSFLDALAFKQAAARSIV